MEAGNPAGIWRDPSGFPLLLGCPVGDEFDLVARLDAERDCIRLRNIVSKGAEKAATHTAALDYATRKESTPKSQNSAAPVPMPELLAKHLQDWINKRYKTRMAISSSTQKGGRIRQTTW